ncbi:MAG: segregation/condensation protein A [Oscillospiraceae bacterium]|jgi:segregation and condensation protein A|nr:segregation/condensation protein A [Oscillospiraceae bacterium]
MEKLTFKLEAFEGPLDLLLQLIAKNKLDILDIPIAQLVDQYMEQIHAMQQQNMDIASEFLEMAARLVYIKTVSLLPKPQEAETLTRELSGQLLEYQECKRLASKLGEKISFDSIARQPEKIEFDQAYRGRIAPETLYQAYYSAAGRGKRFLPPPAEAFSGIVKHKIVSVASRITGILHSLRGTGAAAYPDLYRSCQSRSELVATFLAVLELIRGKRIRVEGEHDSVVKLMDGGEKV